MEGRADRSTCEDGWRTKVSSTSPTARIGVRARSRATRRSARGRADSPGRCSDSPSSSNSSSTLTADARQDSGAAGAESALVDAARATCDFYIDSAACADGVPYWDTGAPGLSALGDWGGRAADPFNDREPVDSSAAAIGAQGLLRFGRFLQQRGDDGTRYIQAGLRVLDTLFDDAGPYVSRIPEHQGLLLHSVYHWPNGWDHVPQGARTPRGESSQWGDYHAREAALYVKRLAEGGPYLAFYGPVR